MTRSCGQGQVALFSQARERNRATHNLTSYHYHLPHPILAFRKRTTISITPHNITIVSPPRLVVDDDELTVDSQHPTIMSGSNIAAANFFLFFTEALRRFMGATPNETFEFNQPTLPPAPPVAQEEEVAVNAPPVQWADEEEEEDEEAGVGAIDLDDGDEEESEAEDGEVNFVWSELRRNSTMIMDLYEVSHHHHIVDSVHSPCSSTGRIRSRSRQRRRRCLCGQREQRADPALGE